MNSGWLADEMEKGGLARPLFSTSQQVLHPSTSQETQGGHGVAVSASLLFNAQVPVEPMARVCAAGYDDLSPDSDDDSPRLTKDPRSAACGAEVSPLKPVMPRVLTTVSSMVKHPETSTWHVRMGDDVPKLFYANGPARIVLYNYNVVREMWHARNMLLSRGLFFVFVSRECIVIV